MPQAPLTLIVGAVQLTSAVAQRPAPLDCSVSLSHVLCSAVALACTASCGMSLLAGQADGPLLAIRVSGVNVAPARQVLPALDAADAVERELVARAIALGEADIAEVDALLGHADWTLRHLALEALGRTCVSRLALNRDPIECALRDAHVELRVAALGATRLDSPGGGVDALPVWAAEDPEPEVRLAAVRVLVSLMDPREHWWSPEEEFPAQLFRGDDDAVELERRLAWTSGPSMASLARALPTLEWSGDTWLAAQHSDVLAPGAWGAIARDYAALTWGDPWKTVVTCFEECLAHRDWRRGPLAHILRDLAATPAQHAIALALMAHVRELLEVEAAILVEGIASLCAEYGVEGAGRVLLPASRLKSPVVARALQRAMPDAADDVRALVARCATAAVGREMLGESEPDLAAVVLRAVARAQVMPDSGPLLRNIGPALLVQVASHAGHAAGAQGVFTRPVIRARDDLRAALHGAPAIGAETRYCAELAIGERLARDGQLGAALRAKDLALPSLGAAGTAGRPSPAWWEADADFLAALAHRAATYEPAAAARLAEAALVAHMGLPEGRSEHGSRVTRTELLALWLGTENAAGEQRGTADESKATTEARMEHFERASLIAGELVAGMALANLEQGFAARDPRGVDVPTIERLFGTPEPERRVDPRARLSAAIDQLALHALLGFLSRGDVTTTGWIWTRDFSVAFRRADWVARSSAARALEDRMAKQYERHYRALAPAHAQELESQPAPVKGGR